jgi:hypothetical protein
VGDGGGFFLRKGKRYLPEGGFFGPVRFVGLGVLELLGFFLGSGLSVKGCGVGSVDGSVWLGRRCVLFWKEGDLGGCGLDAEGARKGYVLLVIACDFR